MTDLNRTARAILNGHEMAWAFFPAVIRKPRAKRAYLKSKCKALIEYDRTVRGEK